MENITKTKIIDNLANAKIDHTRALKKLKDEDFKFNLKSLYNAFFTVTKFSRNISCESFKSEILQWLKDHPVKRINKFAQCEENMFCLFYLHKATKII